MRARWRIVLPVAGLLLFAGETYESARMNLRINRSDRLSSHRYFYWADIPLDSDPLNKSRAVAPSCQNAAENCATWDLRVVIVDPGAITVLGILSGLPAFVLGLIIVSGLGRLGVNQIWSFMISMPLLLFSWYYFVGWLLDRWRLKRRQKDMLAASEDAMSNEPARNPTWP